MRKCFSLWMPLIVCVCLFTTTVSAQTFVAPFGSLPDPNITYYNGWYYYTGTSGNGVYLKKAQTLEGLKHTTMTKVFSSANGGPCCDYWAPELHKINNKWYIYYTAKYEGDGQRTYVIENTSAEPMTGTWTHKGKIYDSQNDVWSIDGTVFESNGKNYFVWSSVAKASDGNKPQRLYIALMTNPWTIQPGRVLLSSPSMSWEKDGNVNEGPAVIKHSGKIFLTYSANGCWTSNYLIAMLYMTEGGNPLNAGAWTKHDQPLFTKFPTRDVYGPGHHSFFNSPDGKEVWFTYHATPDAGGDCGGTRSTRAQRVYWDAKGFPSLGLADATGAWLTAPSGEPAIPANAILPNGIYKIKPTSSNKPLDLSGCNPMRNTVVQQWDDNGSDCQKWHIIATPDGYYSVNAVKGGLPLSVEDCSSSNGASVLTGSPSGSDCQKWIIEQVSTGVYRFKSKKSGKVLDIQFGGTNNGAKLQIYDYLGNAQQHFKLERLDTYSANAFESYNYPGYFIRSLDGRAKIDKNISPQQDGQWRMVPGLAGKGISFQSVNFPNKYLRHSNGQVLLQNHDGSTLFTEDATYYVRAGLADASKVSFESYNSSGKYIRHKSGLLYTETVTAGTGYKDATFTVADQAVAPVVTLTSPADNSTYTAPATVNMVATASVPYASIAKVEFYNGTTLIGTEYTAPYTYTWKNVAAGTYMITAKAIDSKGITAVSSAKKVIINNPPNQLPAVSITAPAANSTYIAPASIAITASASDADGSIAKVEFYNGSTKLGEKTAAPYTYSWTNVAVGTYSITAKATDNKGGSTTSAVRVINVYSGENKLPVISLTAPAANATYTAPASITLTASASDSDGSVAKVEFYNGTTKLGEKTASPYSYTWTSVAEGTYSLTAKVTDDRGGTATSAAVSVKVNAAPNQSPAVSLTAPANNSSYNAPASITITVSATDADGTISKVEFYNGTTKLGEKTTSPYSYTWTSVAAGTYSITAKATDNKGAVTTSAARTVIVNTVATNACTSIAAYVENNGYTAGSKVKNANNRYECKPFPYSGWCNGAAWAYAPGTGAYWSDAWTLLGSCSARESEQQTTTAAHSIELFPNPTSNTVTINVPSNMENCRVNVSDVTGHSVRQTTLNGNVLDLSDLKPGLYILWLEQEGERTPLRVVKH